MNYRISYQINDQRNYFLSWIPTIYNIIYSAIIRVFNTFLINRVIDGLEYIFTSTYTNGTRLTI